MNFSQLQSRFDTKEGGDSDKYSSENLIAENRMATTSKWIRRKEDRPAVRRVKGVCPLYVLHVVLNGYSGYLHLFFNY